MLIKRFLASLAALVATLGVSANAQDAMAPMGTTFDAPYSDQGVGSGVNFVADQLMDYDLQVFAPADFSLLDEHPKPSTGVFATYDRTYSGISGPSSSTFLGQSAPDFNYTVWGNRFELGFMGENSKGWTATIQTMAGMTYTIKSRLVRGLDYYNKTVFEWTTDKLGAQATVCGGGRYDMMVSQFGGKATPASGFAAGLERLVLLMQTLNVDAIAAPDLYIVSSDENAFGQAMLEADRIRAEFRGLGVVQHLGGGSFKSQFKRADKSGAAWAMVFGVEEMVSGKVTLKPLRANEEQMTLSREDLDVFLGQLEQLTSEY